MRHSSISSVHLFDQTKSSELRGKLLFVLRSTWYVVVDATSRSEKHVLRMYDTALVGYFSVMHILTQEREMIP